MWGQCGLEGGPAGIEKMRDRQVWGGRWGGASNGEREIRMVAAVGKSSEWLVSQDKVSAAAANPRLR